METKETGIEGLLVIEAKLFTDHRGYFFESYNAETYKQFPTFIQDNQSYSTEGVIRGIHFQKPPYSQAKLVRVLKGEILDVAVDLRINSPTFLKHYAIKLSAKNNLQLYLPEEFGHGFSVLSPDAVVMYKVNKPYNKHSDGGIRYDDKKLNINWETVEPILSQKDLLLPTVEQLFYSRARL